MRCLVRAAGLPYTSGAGAVIDGHGAMLELRLVRGRLKEERLHCKFVDIESDMKPPGIEPKTPW